MLNIDARDMVARGAIEVINAGVTGTRTFSWSGADRASGLMFAIMAAPTEPETSTSRQNALYATATVFAEQIKKTVYGSNPLSIPESDSDLTIYEATEGPLGMNLLELLLGLEFAGINWEDLTVGQQIWLLENFNDIFAGNI